MTIMGSSKLMAAMEGFVVCLVISLQVLGGAAAIVQPPPLLFVFGDGNLDVGNNNFLSGNNVLRANRLYYGVDFPGIPTGRFSNGYNTADYIAKKIRGDLALSPLPYLSVSLSSSLVATAARTTGMNYASGGAGILDSTNAGNTIPLRTQVQYFNATRSAMMAAPLVGSAAVDTLLSKSIFLIEIGSNDVSAFANAQQRSGPERDSDVAAFAGSLMSNYSAIITDLYTLGARKFAIINAGLDGCLPAALVLDASGLCAEAPCSLNSSVCADRVQHYFWDALHFTQQAAKQRADFFYDEGPGKYTMPINFEQLVNMTA